VLPVAAVVLAVGLYLPVVAVAVAVNVKQR